MEIRKFKCFSCGEETVLCTSEPYGNAKPKLYLYEVCCQNYNCNLPYSILGCSKDKCDIRYAQELYEQYRILMEDYK